jgi:ATP-binding cassette subfamily B protein
MLLVRSSVIAGQELRFDLTQHLMNLSASFFDRTRVGELMSLANGDVESIRMAMGPGLLMSADALFYLLTVPFAMWWISPKLTLICLCTLPLVPLIVYFLNQKIHFHFKQVQDQKAKLGSFAQESLGGMRVIKAFGKEDVQLNRYAEQGHELVKKSLRLSIYNALFGPSLDFILSLGMLLLVFFGGGWVLEGSVTLGTFIAFQRYLEKMIWPMVAIGMSLSHFQKAKVSSSRLKATFRSQSEIPLSSYGHKATIRGEIEVRELSFSYGAGEKVLDRISFKLSPGQSLGLVGRIGSGKSTLFQLLVRFYLAPKGTVFIDGVDLWDWDLDCLRSQIGMVTQDVFLLSETLEDNLKMGRAFTHQEQLLALQQAALSEDLKGQNLNLQTLLGERGVNLSGGQKQRLSLARALIRKSPLLFLDDTLSSVDLKTENLILKALTKIHPKPTRIIASHRLSSVENCDQILVLDKGCIKDRGTHAELIRRDGVYREFYLEQQMQAKLTQELMDAFDQRRGPAGVTNVES